jgi:hypothetical protein
MYVRGYLQGSENGRVVTIDLAYVVITSGSAANTLAFTEKGGNKKKIWRPLQIGRLK